MFTPNELSQLIPALFPNFKDLGITHYEAACPPRALPPSAIVTRFAPSPTGFMHIGGIYAALICRFITRQSGGVFYLRIEDTDIQRTIPGALETILRAFRDYGLAPDEGPMLTESGSVEEAGSYGPYVQTKRVALYTTCAVELIRRGLAYPCFASSDEIEAARQEQLKLKLTPGWYGKWATSRTLSVAQILEKLSKGESFVIRFRSTGDESRRIGWVDGIKGELSLPENFSDVILLKSDGIPTYHFAHLVDDHFMRSTHVVRSEEWLPSTSLHLQLFQAMGWPHPTYTHIPPIMKIETVEVRDEATGEVRTKDSRRKLSKRHDPEANYEYYEEHGIPRQAVLEYLLNIANSSFEDWRVKFPDRAREEFTLTLEGFSRAGALSDLVKVHSIGKRVISTFPVPELCTSALEWARRWDSELAGLMSKDIEYTKQALNAIQNDGPKSGKRITCWKDLRFQLTPFFDELYSVQEGDLPANVPAALRAEIARQVADELGKHADSAAWFEGIKGIARRLGFAEKMGDYKKNPAAYPGSVADVAMVARVAIVGRKESPDLFFVTQVLGTERAAARLRGMAAKASS